MMDEKCNRCNCTAEKCESLAMTVLKDYSARTKRWFIACIVILLILLATITGLIWTANRCRQEPPPANVQENNTIEGSLEPE